MSNNLLDHGRVPGSEGFGGRKHGRAGELPCITSQPSVPQDVEPTHLTFKGRTRFNCAGDFKVGVSDNSEARGANQPGPERRGNSQMGETRQQARITGNPETGFSIEFGGKVESGFESLAEAKIAADQVRSGQRQLEVGENCLIPVAGETARRCRYCGRNLAIEPAIREPLGLSCFPCRRKVDQPAREKFITEQRLYGEQRAEWQKQHGATWSALEAKVRRVEYLIAGAFVLPVVCAVFFAWAMVDSERPPGLLVIGVLAVFILHRPLLDIADALLDGLIAPRAARALSALAERHGCPPPPARPSLGGWPARSRPDLLFDSNREADLDPRLRDFKPGYPPDWEERRTKCLHRDGYSCRVCGNVEHLDVHHVIPVSRKGNHSLQNLITLCRSCHEDEDYYGHKQLVQSNRGRSGCETKFFL